MCLAVRWPARGWRQCCGCRSATAVCLLSEALCAFVTPCSASKPQVCPAWLVDCGGSCHALGVPCSVQPEYLCPIVPLTGALLMLNSASVRQLANKPQLSENMRPGCSTAAERIAGDLGATLCLLVSRCPVLRAQHVTCSSAATWRCRQPASPSASGAQQAARWPSACTAAAEGQSSRCVALAAGQQQNCPLSTDTQQPHHADMLTVAPAQSNCS